MFYCLFYCLSNRKFERLGDPLDEIVTVSVHKYNVIMSRPNMTSFDSRDGLPDVGCFVRSCVYSNLSLWWRVRTIECQLYGPQDKSGDHGPTVKSRVDGENSRTTSEAVLRFVNSAVKVRWR